MATVTSLHYLYSNHISILDERSAAFEESIKGIADKWSGLITNMAGNLTSDAQRANLQVLQNLSNQLQGQLNQLGYDDLAAKFISGYTNSEVFAAQVMELLGQAGLHDGDGADS